MSQLAINLISEKSCKKILAFKRADTANHQTLLVPDGRIVEYDQNF